MLLSGLRRACTLVLLLLAITPESGFAAAAEATAFAPLAVVKPTTDCADLAKVDLSKAVGAATTITAKVVDTTEGQLCPVNGNIAPTIGIEVDLPVAKWTQRFLQAGCGGLCGSINASIGNAGTCLPATNGEFVVAASDLGHEDSMMSPTAGDFGQDPQKLIDFAYRANHVTAVAAKALIAAYYGQPQRFAYFSGCSDGGREAMMEAERYPDDFDGISAGAPAMLFTVQNSFWHAWTTAANLDAAGRPILYADKLAVLHKAVIEHCDGLDGNADGLLTDPRACSVKSEWVECAANATDTSQCLTQAEWAVAAKLYAGPVDAAGHHFLPGSAQPGSELQWDFVPPRPKADGQPAAMNFGDNMLSSMSKVIYRAPTDSDADASKFPFTTAQFKRAATYHALLDATNPDLSGFDNHGGKLVLWHGLDEQVVQPNGRALGGWLETAAFERRWTGEPLAVLRNGTE